MTDPSNLKLNRPIRRIIFFKGFEKDKFIGQQHAINCSNVLCVYYNKERVENIGISALGIFELGREKNEGFKVDDTILLVGRGKETIKQ